MVGEVGVNRPSYDLVIVLTRCPDSYLQVSRIIAKSLREGKYRFLIDLRGPRFVECIELVRRLTQEFISASFTVTEYGEAVAKDYVTI